MVPDGGVVEDGGGVVGLLGLSGDGDVRVVSPRGVISESAAAPAESRDCRRLLAAESAALFTVLAAESVIDCTVPEAESRTVGAGGGGVVVELGGVVRMVVSRIVVSRIMVLLSVGLGAIGEVDGGVDGGVDGDVTDGDGEVVDGLVVDGLVVSGDVVDGDTSPPCSLLMRFRSCAPTVPADTRSAAAVSAASAVPAKGMLGRRDAATALVMLSFMGPSWLGPARAGEVGAAGVFACGECRNWLVAMLARRPRRQPLAPAPLWSHARPAMRGGSANAAAASRRWRGSEASCGRVARAVRGRLQVAGRARPQCRKTGRQPATWRDLVRRRARNVCASSQTGAD